MRKPSFPSAAGSCLFGFGANGAVAAAPGSDLRRWGVLEAISNGVPSAVRVDGFIVVMFAGVLKNLWVYVSAAFGAGQGVTYTVYVDDAPTGITVTLSGAGSGSGITFGNSGAASFAVAAGQRVALHCDRAVGVPGGVTHVADLQLVAA